MTDTGSWVLVGRYLLPYTREGRESWCGLSTDFEKLPHTGTTGSTAYCIDTGKRYMFEKTTDTWYPVVSGNADGAGVPSETEYYAGSYEVTPSASTVQTLPTANKFMKSNLTIEEIPYAETDNDSEGITVSIAAG